MLNLKSNVAFLFPQNLQSKMNWSFYVKKAKNSHNINFIPFSFQNDEKLLAVLHKLTYEIAESNFGNKISKEFIEKFQKYTLETNIKVIEPIELIEIFTDREKTMKKFSEYLKNKKIENFKCSPHIILNNKEDAEKAINEKTHLQFPVICKPINACGTQSSHNLTIIANENGLKKYSNFPSLIERFFNHNAIVYKLYIIGNFSHWIMKNSLPDIPFENLNLFENFSFDSQKPLPQNYNQEKINQNLNQEKINQNLNQEKINQNLNQEKINQNLNQEKINQNLNQEKIIENLNQEKINQNSNQEKIIENLNQEKIIENLNQEKINQNSNQEKIISSPSNELIQSVVSSVSSALFDCFGVGLLGADLVFDYVSSCFYVIDINYFPRTLLNEEFQDKFSDFIKSKI
ncbi:inositol-tetrakisphosphate 1-kinase [Anaeramoeba ignava]|uniref:Inositol-tetrakisphosphate 1-kinase n=1 Tax=Anaeramoeba ignava TaxID=1746090 RepID=A0A9Q0LSI7_ANAIG|nr:inositol-tetrakisphosphate 1-kinase [Anaeramoeba ignava]